MVWENIYKNKLPGAYLQYPSDGFVSTFYNALSYVKNKNACLDYGCGSGNTAQVMLPHFEKLYLLDISPSALEIARSRLNLPEAHCFQRLEAVPKVDFISAWGVLCYSTPAQLKENIEKFHDKLNDGGVIMCSITSKRDAKVQCADQISTHEYVINATIPQQQGAHICAFEKAEEFESMLSPFFEILDMGEFGRISYKQPEKSLYEFYYVAQKR